MDERTRRTDDEAAPNLRRTAPAPVIKSRTGRTGRMIVGLIVLIGVVVGAYLIFRSLHTGQPATAGRSQQAVAQSVGAATIGKGDIRVIVNALGTVTPIATVTVQTQIDGQLTQVALPKGRRSRRATFWRKSTRDPTSCSKPNTRASWRAIKDFSPRRKSISCATRNWPSRTP